MLTPAMAPHPPYSMLFTPGWIPMLLPCTSAPAMACSSSALLPRAGAPGVPYHVQKPNVWPHSCAVPHPWQGAEQPPQCPCASCQKSSKAKHNGFCSARCEDATNAGNARSWHVVVGMHAGSWRGPPSVQRSDAHWPDLQKTSPGLPLLCSCRMPSRNVLRRRSNRKSFLAAEYVFTNVRSCTGRISSPGMSAATAGACMRSACGPVAEQTAGHWPCAQSTQHSTASCVRTGDQSGQPSA
jgi:hypothetical protein